MARMALCIESVKKCTKSIIAGPKELRTRLKRMENNEISKHNLDLANLSFSYSSHFDSFHSNYLHLQNKL